MQNSRRRLSDVSSSKNRDIDLKGGTFSRQRSSSMIEMRKAFDLDDSNQTGSQRESSEKRTVLGSQSESGQETPNDIGELQERFIQLREKCLKMRAMLKPDPEYSDKDIQELKAKATKKVKNGLAYQIIFES